jgi:putative alpha-1,2-mannosidase
VGLAEPITHTLDLAFGYQCTSKVAHYVGDKQLATQFERVAGQWVNAFNRNDGLLLDSTYYEGGKWSYSFRLLHDMKAGIDLAGGEDTFIDLLDRFSASAPTLSSSWANVRPPQIWRPDTR